MKKNDLAVIILIASLTLVAGFFTVKGIFGEPQAVKTKVEKVVPIASSIEQPQARTFNSNALNPTVVIQIGNPSNQQPFGL